MAKEIERKFVVTGEGWQETRSTTYRQGYLSTEKERTVRIRIADDKGYVTIKGCPEGMTRDEYEYEIPLQDAEEMLETLCKRPLIEKRRHKIIYGGLRWDIDEFLGDNAGLVLAEVELSSAEQAIELPPWLGEEVTEDARYFNVNLVEHPYRQWQAPPVSSGSPGAGKRKG